MRTAIFSRSISGLLAGLALLGAGCLRPPLGPSAPPAAGGPGPIPTVSATVVVTPGDPSVVPMSVLGQVPCSWSAPGAKPAILRSAADWSAWMAGVGCAAAPPGALDLSGFDFSAQSVLILQYEACGSVFSNTVNIWNVLDRGSYLVAQSDVSGNVAYPGYITPQADCRSVAVAIPATSLGVAWSICEQEPSYHCNSPVTY